MATKARKRTPVRKKAKPRKSTKVLAPSRPVEHLIRQVRGQRVMLDADLAVLYGVETRALNQAVRRNAGRFPADFLFQLTSEEADSLRSQIVISNAGRGGRRYTPLAFTEHGIAMLSSVLNSERAVQVNILIVRAFVRIREIMAANRDLSERIEKLESKHARVTSVLELLVDDLEDLTEEVKRMKAPPERKPRRIGFRSE